MDLFPVRFLLARLPEGSSQSFYTHLPFTNHEYIGIILHPESKEGIPNLITGELENGPVEIVDLPSYIMVDLSSSLRVSLPEGFIPWTGFI